MITLSGIVLVFLLGYWSGYKMCHAGITSVDSRSVVEALEDLRNTVLTRRCPKCGSTSILIADVDRGKQQRFCGDCLEPVS